MADLTKEQKQTWFLLSLPVLRWNISATCKLVGISRAIFYVWLEDPEFEARYKETREELADYLEERSLDIIDLGDGTQLRAHLQAIAKERGWGPKKDDTRRLPEGGQHIHFHLPPPPKNLADWEAQVIEARKVRALPIAEAEVVSEPRSNGSRQGDASASEGPEDEECG